MPPAAAPQTLEWIGGDEGCLRLIDQTRLPAELVYLDCRDAAEVWQAIRALSVRGAPAIGIAAAYGLCLGVRAARGASTDEFFAELNRTVDYLAGSRPTAVNLSWALARLQRLAEELRDRAPPAEIWARLLAEARALHEADRRTCRAIGRHGAPLLAGASGVLTHCNAGGLATAEYGTALALIFTAHESGQRLCVYADETRPLLQGARLTAWELVQRGIEVTLLCDSMAPQVLREGKVQAVVVGADRIAANGDTANKIGTYGLALAARAHQVPFYVAAPSSTFDLALPDGQGIPIEERDPREVTHGFGLATAPLGVQVYNPAFDVTPAELISAIVCEWGVIAPVSAAAIARMLAPPAA